MASSQAVAGSMVRVHYNGYLEDGTPIGSSRETGPVEFTIGESTLIPAFENAVVGMGEGDTKTVSLAPEDAFGERREELVRTIGKDQLPSHIDPQVGKFLEIHADEGENVRAQITDVTEDRLTIDANHPLAGRKITFEIELVKIEEK
jgi:FKBP-type peptidyl-prolyl cis-trans isomerase 2